MQIIEKPLDKLIMYSNNNKIHTDTQIHLIANSIAEFGRLQPIVIDGNNVIIAGHGRYLAGLKLGKEKVPCVLAENLTPVQIKKYRLLDNKLSSIAEYDIENIKIELEDLQDIELNELFSDIILQDAEFGRASEDQDNFEIPEEIKTNIIYGDIIEIGNHRIVCGDSTKKKDIEKLMNLKKADMVFTDPPYGVSASGGRSQTVEKKNIKKIENDELRGGNLFEFIEAFIKNIFIKEGGNIYICYDQKTQYEFQKGIRESNFDFIRTLVRNKNNFGLSGKKGYRPKYELILFASSGKDYNRYGGNDKADVIECARPTERPGNHPTPKPVSLVEGCIENSSKIGDIVVDLFLGSGATLVACENIGRICYSCELEPKYCQISIDRILSINPTYKVKINGIEI